MEQLFIRSSRREFSFARARARIYSSAVAIAAAALVLFSVPAISAAPLTFAQASSDLKSSDLGRRYAAAVALKNFGPQGAAKALASRLTSEKNIDVLCAMLDSLAGLHEVSTISFIAPLLSHPSPIIRQRAALAIGLIGGSPAEKALLAALPTEKDLYVRTTELQELSVCGSANSMPVLQSALDDAKPEVRAQAIEALHHIPGPDSANTLKHHHETNPELRKRVDEAVKTQPSGAQ